MGSSSEGDAALRERIRQQEAVADLGQQALEGDDLDQLMQDASVAVAETLDNDYCKVLELLPGADEVFLRQGVGWRDGLVGNATVPTDLDSQAGYTLISEEPVIVDDLRTEDRFSGPKLLTSHDVVSGISVIIGSVEDPWGVLGTHTTEHREFTENDATFVKNVANVLAAAIDRREKEERLRERERHLERYETIIEVINDGVYVVDEDSTFQMVNETYAEILGYDPEDLVGTKAASLVDRDVIDAVDTLLEATEEGHVEKPSMEANLRTASGEWLPAEATFARLPESDDSDWERVGVVRDISGRKERERALQESERRYRTLVEHFPDGSVGLFDEDLTYTAVGGQLLDRLDVDPEDRIGRSIHEIHPEGLLEQIEPHFETALEGEADSFEVEFRGRHLHAHTLPVRNVDDQVYAGMLVVQDVTEQRERERALEEREARFRMLAENLEEMVWISDLETREILYLNPAYEDIWGRDREALYDDPTTFLDDVHPEDRERVEQAYGDVPEEGIDEEYRIVRPDGDVRWLDVRGAPIRDSGKERVIGIAEDITERKERERALEESEQRYRTLAENFPNGAVGLFDEDLEYTAVGGQLLDATGVDPEDRIGSSVYDIYPDELVEEVEPYFHAALDGKANSFEAEFHDRHLYAHTLPVRNAADEVFAGMLVVQDVTERREYQRQLEESNERLEQFAYAASHDLQEPLRMVSSYLQLIEDRYADAFDEEGEEFLEFAVDGADRMREMIDGLLQYSRVETQGDPFEPVDLAMVLDDNRENLQMKIEEQGAEITAESLPRVEGDESQLRQVFQNLLSNAIEYSGDDPPQIQVSAERNGMEWTVSVADEGIGIDQEDQERIFEVFQRVHGPREHSGTGIGLALCERIIERHGGDIWVDSEPGEGATFSFTLPAVHEDTNE